MMEYPFIIYWMTFIGAFVIVFCLLVINAIVKKLGHVFSIMGKSPKDEIILGADMFGRTGYVEDISSCGTKCFIRVGPERWHAELKPGKSEPLRDGEEVNVTGIDGLTLKISPSTRRRYRKK